MALTSMATAVSTAYAQPPTAATTYNYTGGVQTYVVPGGITSVSVSLTGAAGGIGGTVASPFPGGYGGKTTATLAVTPGQTLYIFVGGKGNDATSLGTSGNNGYNGGGTLAGGSGTFAGQGGGASDIRVGATDVYSRVLVAGGGGGGGDIHNGGNGGGLTAASGQSDVTAATGGSQIAAGTGEAGTGAPGNDGAFGPGGDIDPLGEGGGGGGGYFGGGAGSSEDVGGGGGGSSYAAVGATSVSFPASTNTGDGVVTITPIGTIVHAPTFTHGSTQSLIVCQNATPTAINSMLQINDLDPGDTETWTVISGPANGTVTLGPTAHSLGGNLTPYGFSFTPAPGFSGTDAFTVQVSDGTSTATTVINVIVNSIAPITGASTVCIGYTTALSNAFTGGYWTSSIPSSALVGGSTGIVTGVVAGSVLISYTNTSGCVAKTVITVNPLPYGITGSANICLGNTNTYVDLAPGGSWSTASSNITLDGSGHVTGNTVGSATISYTMPSTGCFALKNVNVTAPPAPITGPTQVCIGATVFLTDATAGGVSWSTSDTSRAKVTNAGAVTGGNSAGSATITYTLSTGCYATYGITALSLPPAISGVTNVCAGSSVVLSDASGPGTWTTSSSTVATVGSSTGVVTGVNNGTVRIYYADGNGCATSLLMTVNPIGAITGTFTTCVGSSVNLIDAGSPGGTWVSGSTAVATIGLTSGLVTGVSAGTSIITYTIASGCTRITTVTVNPGLAPITGTATMCAGSSTTLTDASTGGTWTSSTPSVATINTYGIVSGTNPGTSTITYTTSSCRSTQVVTVNQMPTVIAGPAKVCTGYSITLSDGVAGGTWSGTNAAANVDGSGGTVATISGIATGSVVVTYALGTGCSRTYTVAVNQTPVGISGNAVVCAGKQTYLSDATGPGVSWTSNATSVATVTYGGVVTGVSAGTANITYTLVSACYITVVVTVNPSPAVTAILGSTSVAHGGSTQLSDLTSGGVWTSANPAIMSVDATTGLVTSTATSGYSTISYTVSNSFGCSNFVTKNMATTAPRLHSGSTTTTVGAVLSLSADMFANAGEWTSSDNTIATVDGNGVVSTVAPGIVTITNTATGDETHILVNALPMEAGMFPNPNKGTFTVKGNTGATNDAAVSLEITNMLGQVVYNSSVVATGGIINEQIAVNGFASGAYMLNIKSGKERKAIHFVIE